MTDLSSAFVPVPTTYLIGLNRSGTTALTHAFSQNSSVEVIKDPGKHSFETDGNIDYSFFWDRISDPSKSARLVKQSIGQYTHDLCTLPVYPFGAQRRTLVRSITNLFIFRDPLQTWNSWARMTQWLKSADDEATVERWKYYTNTMGIEKGWGTLGQFRLAYLYFVEIVKLAKRLNPAGTVLVRQEWFSDRSGSEAVIRDLCDRMSLKFVDEMIDWKYSLGDERLDVKDGFASYDAMDSLERAKIHETLRKSDTFSAQEAELIIGEADIGFINGGDIGAAYDWLVDQSEEYRSKLGL